MKIRNGVVGTAVAAAAAGAMFLSAGAATAWNDPGAASVGSGEMRGPGEVYISFDNDLDTDIKCAAAIYPPQQMERLREAEAAAEAGDWGEVLRIGTEIEDRVLAGSGPGFTIDVPAGQTVERKYDITPTNLVAGATWCQEVGNAGNMDYTAFEIRHSDDSVDGWGSVEDLFGGMLDFLPF